jgi:hypothetical protein
MNTTDLLVLGLLVLIANLTLSALFVPPRARPSAAEPLVRLWKLLALAFAQIIAWGVVLDQGGAAASLSDAILRAAGCFALVSSVQGASVFPDPWNHFAGLIALNGLLFVPVTLLPGLFPAAVTQSGVADPQPVTAAPQGSPAAASPTSPVAAAPVRPAVVAAPAESSPPVSSPPAATLSAAASPLVAELSRRPAPQPASPAPAAPARPGEPADPEAEYAALMRPLGPTPPPIRFGNRP